MKFSIIMAAYNAEMYIHQAIESVINQTYKNWELIIVDDGSVDETGRIIDDYSQQDGRIIPVHQSNSGTAGAARNTALRYVSGDYVQILDSDDILSEDFLYRYVEGIKAYGDRNEVSIISPLTIMIDTFGNEIEEVSNASKFVGQSVCGIKAFELSLDWKIHGWVALKRDLIMNIRYEEKLINGDEFTTRKFFYNANRVIFTSGKYLYRKNDESTTRSYKNRIRMYETIETDKNIYDYALDNKMPLFIKNRCLKKYCKSLVAHEALYLRTVNEYSKDDGKNINAILERHYVNTLSIAKRKNVCMGIWRLWFILSLGRYSLFKALCYPYNFILSIKNHMRNSPKADNST